MHQISHDKIINYDTEGYTFREHFFAKKAYAKSVRPIDESTSWGTHIWILNVKNRETLYARTLKCERYFRIFRKIFPVHIQITFIIAIKAEIQIIYKGYKNANFCRKLSPMSFEGLVLNFQPSFDLLVFKFI